MLSRSLNKAATVASTATRAFSAAAAAAGEEKLEKTALYDLHLQLGGKMVPFAGYSLPVQYPDGVLKSHLHTREKDCSSLFDVGHMGQLFWQGKDALKFLETLLVADVSDIKQGESKLTLLTNAKGGIIDDSVITSHGDPASPASTSGFAKGGGLYMVVNGATKHGDMAHFDRQLEEFKRRNPGADVRYSYHHDQNLVALQGPGAANVLPKLLSPSDAEALKGMAFMTGRPMKVMGVDGCIVTRCGYTGEDGFEVSMPKEAAVKITTALLDQPGVKPAGLGPRDSLRLEAGLCLYGHDIDEKTTPGEAVLGWTIGKKKRAGQIPFLGSETILKQLNDKSMQRKRVGLAIDGAPAREGAKIYALPKGANASSASLADCKQVGVVTSGTFSPCLKAPIAMGYVASELSNVAADASAPAVIAVEVRGKLIPAKVTKMPFVPNRYYKPAGAK